MMVYIKYMRTKTRWKRNFLAGIAAILPLGLTIFVIWFLVQKLGGLIGRYLIYLPHFEMVPEFVKSLIGLIILVILIYLIGVFASGYIGRVFVKLFNRVMERLPLIKGVYTAAKKLTDTIFIDRSAFSKVVIIHFPSKESRTIAFMTNEEKWQIGDEYYCNVFVPTVPNITTGFYLLYPVKDLIETDIPVDWGFRIAVSGGIILPENRKIDV